MIIYSRGICCKCNAETVIVKRLPSGHYCHKHNQERLNEGKEKKLYSIPKESKKRGKENREYRGKRIIFLIENPVCQLNLNGCTKRASEVHHLYSGKNRSKYFLDVSTWKSGCRNCHDIAHEIPAEEAIEKGLKKTE